MDIDGIVKKALSRRTFLAGAGSAAAVTALAGCSDDGTVTLPSTSAVADTDILNFALNLEYLEAEFYLRSATGNGLSTADIGTGTSTTGTGAGAVTGGAQVPTAGLTTAQTNMINELAYTEQQHVRALRAALGPLAVARPAISLTAGFAGGATAANAISSSLPAIPSTFNPFGDFNSFVVGSFLFEDTGVTAYNGAAPLISVAGIAAGYLAVAAGIMAVEAYHGGMLRTILTGNSINQGTTAYPYALYANRLSLVRAALGGGNETPLQGFQTSATTVAQINTGASGSVPPSTIVPSNGNALAYYRNTDQILHIVYGTATSTAGTASGVSSGGFFPNGLNGLIKTTAS